MLNISSSPLKYMSYMILCTKFHIHEPVSVIDEKWWVYLFWLETFISFFFMFTLNSAMYSSTTQNLVFYTMQIFIFPVMKSCSVWYVIVLNNKYYVIHQASIQISNCNSISNGYTLFKAFLKHDTYFSHLSILNPCSISKEIHYKLTQCL